MFIILAFHIVFAQEAASDMLAKIEAQVKANKGRSYERLAYLSDTYGPRMWGSEPEGLALEYLYQELNEMGFDAVRKEPLPLIHTWSRGFESLTLYSPRKVPQPLKMIGLGLSIAGKIKAEVVVVHSFKELQSIDVEGKIVLFNYEWTGYDDAREFRTIGPVEVAKKKGKAMLMRSIASDSLQTPHTGYTRYNAEVNKIPAAAISVEDADMLDRMYQRKQKIEVELQMENTFYDSKSYNVIAEIKGTEFPNEILVLGGHSDSWDTGSQTGANDDGGGIMVTSEALRILQELGVKPRRTIRFVAWSGEEMSQPEKGAFKYVQDHFDKEETHVLAFESDYGTTKLLGFGLRGTPRLNVVMSKLMLQLPHLSLLLNDEEEMIDTAPIGARGVTVMRNLVLDNERGDFYFKYHHAASDTVSIMNADDMDSNVIGIAQIFYLLSMADI